MGNSRITLDVYTQAVGSHKRAAQSKVVRMMVPNLGEMKGETTPLKKQDRVHCTQIKPTTSVFPRSPIILSHFECMAGTTGLEPATSAVTANR